MRFLIHLISCFKMNCSYFFLIILYIFFSFQITEFEVIVSVGYLLNIVTSFGCAQACKDDSVNEQGNKKRKHVSFQPLVLVIFYLYKNKSQPLEIHKIHSTIFLLGQGSFKLCQHSFGTNSKILPSFSSNSASKTSRQQ